MKNAIAMTIAAAAAKVSTVHTTTALSKLRIPRFAAVVASTAINWATWMTWMTMCHKESWRHERFSFTSRLERVPKIGCKKSTKNKLLVKGKHERSWTRKPTNSQVQPKRSWFPQFFRNTRRTEVNYRTNLCWRQQEAARLPFSIQPTESTCR